MKRRQFIGLVGGAAAAWPLKVRAQQPERIRRIGFLRAAQPPQHELDALLGALSERHYVQGRHFVLVPQWGDGDVAQLPQLAVSLVNKGVELIVTEGTVAVRAAATASASIPIVATSAADPFMGGLVKNLSRPGGNVTGFASMEKDISGKVFGILHEMVPGLRRIGVLASASIRGLFAPGQDDAARALGIEYEFFDMPRAELAPAAMDRALAAGAQGAVIRGSPYFSSQQRRLIIDSAAARRLPAIYERRDDAERGGVVCLRAHVEEQKRAEG